MVKFSREDGRPVFHPTAFSINYGETLTVREELDLYK